LWGDGFVGVIIKTGGEIKRPEPITGRTNGEPRRRLNLVASEVDLKLEIGWISLESNCAGQLKFNEFETSPRQEILALELKVDNAQLD
jgi:hypothetical protein